MKRLIFTLTILLYSGSALAAPLVQSVFDGVPPIFQAGDSTAAETEAKKLLKHVEAVLVKASATTKKTFMPPDKLNELTLRDARLRKLDDGGSRLLLLSKGGNASHINDSVIIVQGDINLSYASRCIIIATGGVSISHGSGNIIFAGYYISVSHDGSYRPVAVTRAQQPATPAASPTPEPPPASSLLMSGNLLDVSHASHTVVSAAGLLSIAHAHGVVGLNLTETDISHRNDMGELIDGALQVKKNEFLKVADGKPLYYANDVFRYAPASPARRNELMRREQQLGREYCFEKETSFRMKDGSVIQDCCGPLTKQLAGFRLVGNIAEHFVLTKDDTYVALKAQQEPIDRELVRQATRSPEAFTKLLSNRVCAFESPAEGDGPTASPGIGR